MGRDSRDGNPTTDVRLFELLDELDPVIEGSEWSDLVAAATATSSSGLNRRIRRALSTAVAASRSYPFPTHTPSGNLRLGIADSGRPVLLDQASLSKHVLAVGQSGAGKTTLFYTLMQQLRVPWWSFDLKQDYRHLIKHDDELLVLPWWNLKFNPLKPPPDVQSKRWAQIFCEIFGHATSLLSGSKNYLLKQVILLYRYYGLLDEPSEPYPTMHDLLELLRSDNINFVRKTSNYRDTLQNRVEAATLTAGPIFDCSQGYSIEKLLQRKVVFEFDGLNRDVQNFLTEILFAYVYEYRMSHGDRTSDLDHVFFVDEGKQVFSVYKERQDAAGIPEIDRLTAKMREFGEGLVVADQEASKLTDSIKANTFTKLLLPTGDQKQFQSIADSMQLAKQQRKFASELKIGEAILQVGNESPVPVSLDEYHVEKDVNDEDLREEMETRWGALSATPRQTTSAYEKHVSNDDGESVEKQQNDSIEISDEARRLLSDVVENPFKSLTERYERFSSQYKGNKAKNEVVEAGIVIERHVRNSERKRKLLQLTEKGRNYAEDSLDLDIERQGRGGIVHRFWQHRIKDALEEAGWDAFLEKFDADVYVNMDDQELAIEVAMGDNPREIEHVEKHLDRGFQVWVACRNREVLDGLEERVQEKDVESDSLVFRLFRQL